ncbi:MAG: endopeptidase La [Gemmatimonadales bacterium]|nr:MAG: endopeptidase La [Gemmatimonadales bacterium]
MATDSKSSPPPPARVPVLPLRGLIAFPGLAMPLQVGREMSVAAAHEALGGDQRLLLLAQRDAEVLDPGPDDLFSMGCLAHVHQCFRNEGGTHKVIVEADQRAAVVHLAREGTCLWAEVVAVDEPPLDGPEAEALTRTVRARFFSYLKLQPGFPESIGQLVSAVETGGLLADTVAAYTAIPFTDKQKLLEVVDPEVRLRTLADILENEISLLEIQHRISDRVRSRLSKSQKEYFLKEQLRAIEEELGQSDAAGTDTAELKEKILEAGMPEDIQKIALREHHRLSQMLPLTPQSVVVTEYLDWLIHMPWTARTDDNLDLRHVARILDEDHYGLDEPKERILEYLAVKKLSHRMREPILCFVGPPGVGKTSLARSVARALGRRFVRKSLGGVRDEAEIRGHRRTYIGAMPGRVVQSIRKAGVRNPVFLLDEIDKMAQDNRGDPASALLEVLDPEENNTFSDHYLEVEWDLSEVLFICTANVATAIPPVLLDRLEVIELAGYTLEEKIAIAERHLLPAELDAHGLTPGDVVLPRDVIQHVTESYTREAGVRNLRKHLARILRKIAAERAATDAPPPEPHAVTVDRVRVLLGPAPYRRQAAGPKEGVGTVTGLAWTEFGGRSMIIEASCMPGKGELTLTGQLGQVMQESVKTALSWVRSRCSRPGVIPMRHSVDLHIHVPEGATPKDGPSAGLPVVCALAPAMSGCPARRDVAITGEVTLQGRVREVGGIKEKVLAAHREGFRRMYLPKANADDLEKVPAEVRSQVEFRFIERVEECLREIVPALKGQFRTRADTHVACRPEDTDA